MASQPLHRRVLAQRLRQWQHRQDKTKSTTSIENNGHQRQQHLLGHLYSQCRICSGIVDINIAQRDVCRNPKHRSGRQISKPATSHHRERHQQLMISYVVSLGHQQVALHTHLASDFQDLQHQVNKMNIDIALQVRHCHWQSRRTHHMLLMQHLYDNWDQDNDDINLDVLCYDAVEIINKKRTLHRQVSSTSSGLTSSKGTPTTKSTTTYSATTSTNSQPSTLHRCLQHQQVSIELNFP